MKKLIFLLVPLLVLLAFPQQTVLAQQSTRQVIDLKWVTFGAADSANKTLAISVNDTTAWYAISDSSAQGGGVELTLFTSDGDTIKALAKAQWGVLEPSTGVMLPYKTATVLDSLTYGWHTGATTNNPIGEPLSFRVPKGATHVRFTVATGTSVKQFNSGGTARALAKLDGKLILPKF